MLLRCLSPHPVCNCSLIVPPTPSLSLAHTHTQRLSLTYYKINKKLVAYTQKEDRKGYNGSVLMALKTSGNLLSKSPIFLNQTEVPLSQRVVLHVSEISSSRFFRLYTSNALRQDKPVLHCRNVC